MLTRCTLCGGENEIHPGQKILSCSFCGSSLALEESSGPEHLILPHEKNERAAICALRSYLLEKRLARPSGITAEFMFLPYLIVEDSKGSMATAPAKHLPPWAPELPFPPAGDYCFFDEKLARGEKVMPFRGGEGVIRRIIHIPVYHIKYRSAGRKWEAAVFGESLIVAAAAFPPEKPAAARLPNMIAALGLFALFLLAGRIGSGFAGRMLTIALAASAGYAAMGIWERTARRAG